MKRIQSDEDTYQENTEVSSSRDMLFGGDVKGKDNILDLSNEALSSNKGKIDSIHPEVYKEPAIIDLSLRESMNGTEQNSLQGTSTSGKISDQEVSEIFEDSANSRPENLLEGLVEQSISDTPGSITGSWLNPGIDTSTDLHPDSSPPEQSSSHNCSTGLYSQETTTLEEISSSFTSTKVFPGSPSYGMEADEFDFPNGELPKQHDESPVHLEDQIEPEGMDRQMGKSCSFSSSSDLEMISEDVSLQRVTSSQAHKICEFSDHLLSEKLPEEKLEKTTDDTPEPTSHSENIEKSDCTNSHVPCNLFDGPSTSFQHVTEEKDDGSCSGSDGEESSDIYVPDSHDSSSDENREPPLRTYRGKLRTWSGQKPDEQEDEEEDTNISEEVTSSCQEVTDDKKAEGQITVMTTNNQEKVRCYDKTAYCVVCSKPQKKLPVHLQQHASEPEVEEYLNEKSPSKKNIILTKLRNRGNHNHNCDVVKEGKGELIVVYRPTVYGDPSDYQPCVHCLGWYSKTEMWKHRCVLKQQTDPSSGSKSRESVVRAGRELVPPCYSSNATEMVHKMLCNMKQDEISLCIKNDSLMLDLANKLAFKLGHDKENFGHMRSKLREIARLLLEFRILADIPNASLADLISPVHFMNVVKAARVVSGFDEDTHLYQTPSLALKIGHTLKKVAMIQVSKALMCEDEEVEKKSRDFHKLCSERWDEEVSSHALRTLYANKRNKPKLLPLSEDVISLSQYLKENVQRNINELKKDDAGKEKKDQSWRELGKLVLTQLIVFNRRRQGEVSKMTLDDLNGLKRGENHTVEGQVLSKLEQDLIKILWRVEISGKRGRTVPVLMTNSMKDSIDVLVKGRNEAGVDPSNKFVFAVSKRKSDSHIRGSDALREYSTKCGAKNPSNLRSTRLRKQIATMSQVMNLQENELDVLASYLGHDIRIHREYYRLPDSSIQVAKVSKLLFALEGEGGTPSAILPNQSLDSLEFNSQEGMQYHEFHTIIITDGKEGPV